MNIGIYRTVGILIVSAVPRVQSSTAPENTGDLSISQVEYANISGKPLSLCLVESKAPGSEARPVVAFLGWGGAKDGVSFLSSFARKGYLGVSIGFRRQSPEALWIEQIQDCKCALRFLRAKAGEYRLDPEHIGVYGFSAGGHLAALLGTSGDVKALEGNGGWPEWSSRVQAVVDLAGWSDFRKLIHDSRPGPAAWRKFLGTIREHPQEALLASPVKHVSADDPPFLIRHGERDSTVPLEQSQMLASALRTAKVEVDLQVIPGAGHGDIFGKLDMKQIAAFFDAHLKPTKEKQSQSK